MLAAPSAPRSNKRPPPISLALSLPFYIKKKIKNHFLSDLYFLKSLSQQLLLSGLSSFDPISEHPMRPQPLMGWISPCSFTEVSAAAFCFILSSLIQGKRAQQFPFHCDLQNAIWATYTKHPAWKVHWNIQVNEITEKPAYAKRIVSKSLWKRLLHECEKFKPR